MEDQSYLDKKYFIDNKVYNCPFCNRRNVRYFLIKRFEFDWTSGKNCFVYLVKCSSCTKTSMHLSFTDIANTPIDGPKHIVGVQKPLSFCDDIDLDSEIFYSVPTSFFVMDNRIPKIIRELIMESEGCLKMNFLTGASACMRKAIYELLVIKEVKEDDYESKIKSLKKKYPDSDPTLFDSLAAIQGMTSDKAPHRR